MFNKTIKRLNKIKMIHLYETNRAQKKPLYEAFIKLTLVIMKLPV